MQASSGKQQQASSRQAAGRRALFYYNKVYIGNMLQNYVFEHKSKKLQHAQTQRYVIKRQKTAKLCFEVLKTFKMRGKRLCI